MHDEILLDVKHLSHQFKLSKKTIVKAVNDVSFQIRKGEVLGLVGESGSGKSTVARCIMNIYKSTSGSILYDGIDLCKKIKEKEQIDKISKEIQIIFQDSTASLNQRMRIEEIIAEPLMIHNLYQNKKERLAYIKTQLKRVGLEENYLHKYPPEISGGQRQRVSIARVLGMEPRLLIADEPIASLDVSIQAQIINLFKHLQMEHGFSFLFIAHDLSMVEFISDRVGVMYRGQLVELARTKDLYSNPLHPYTQALLSSIPIPDPRLERDRKVIKFDETYCKPDMQFVEVEEEHFVMKEV